MDKRDERRELIKELAVASYHYASMHNIPDDKWVQYAVDSATALLAALDQQSPPTPPINQCDGCQRGLPLSKHGHHMEDGHPVMACTADRYAAAPGGEPKERVCRWTVTNHTVGSGIYERRLYVTGCEDKRHESRETGADFCKYCGGKIITEAT